MKDFASEVKGSVGLVSLVREVDKLTLGQNINAKVPHAVTALMNSQGHKWLTNSRMTHYQRTALRKPMGPI